MTRVNTDKKSSTCSLAVDALIELARRDEKIVVVTCDVANSTECYRFEREFPDRFFNVGIAEQNAVAMSSGLARVGFKPYVMLFSSFASKRALDFIFADVCYPKLPVRIIATHGGTSFGEAGPTHHALSDLTVMRSMPNISLIVPADGVETREAVLSTENADIGCYIRINRGEDFDVYVGSSDFTLGKANVLKAGGYGYIIANGSCVHEALLAAEILENEGKPYGVIDMHSLSPFDENAVIRAAETGRIITVEDARPSGLGGLVAETVADNGLSVKLRRLGVEGISVIGKHDELIKYNGIGYEEIARVGTEL